MLAPPSIQFSEKVNEVTWEGTDEGHVSKAIALAPFVTSDCQGLLTCLQITAALEEGCPQGTLLLLLSSLKGW